MHALRVTFVDSHTEGEPTRVITGGLEPPPGRSVAERARSFDRDFGWLRGAAVDEPRGSDVLVGALLVPPSDPSADVGAIFFNPVGALGMCGHGTIGLARTLVHMGRARAGTLRVETPSGTVTASIPRGDSHAVTVGNVRSWAERLDVELRLEDGRVVHGDLAWGGNGFLLVHDHGDAVELANVGALARTAWMCRRALERAGIATVNGRVVDHVELEAPPADPGNHGRAFVLCPGGAYDRSPCGTGTSAKLACLAARGQLAPGATWRQESVIGSVFEASYEAAPEGDILPSITGRAWITGEGSLVIDGSDPYRHGIHAAQRVPRAPEALAP
jgi:4-hydroxyproline epimerase